MARDINDSDNLADFDDDDYGVPYEDDYAYTEDAPRRESVAYENSSLDDAPQTPAAKLPLRAIAMVLIAVALMLGLWGIYVSTQGDKDNSAEEKASTVQSSSANQPGAAGNSAAKPGEEGKVAAEGQPGDEAKDAKATDAKDAANKDKKPAAEGEKKPAGQAAGKVNVLNNGAVPGLAQTMVDQLNQQGQNAQLGASVEGCLPGNLCQVYLQQNTVFFDPNTPGAEERARVLADQVGGFARANDGTVGAANQNPNDLTLVIINQP